MMKRRIWIASALAISIALAGGCTKNQKQTAKPSESTTKPALNPIASTATSVSRDQLPAELKNDAYYYYGLNAERPLHRQVVQHITGQPEAAPVTGSLSAKLIDVKNGKAIFDIEMTGGLATNGNQQFVLMKDGLYASKLGENVFDPPQMELPSPLTPGKSWTNKSSATLQNGMTFSQDISLKVVGPEKVSTKAGNFDAIRVNGGGTWTLNGKSYNVKMSGWYVKNQGEAKVELEMIRKGDPKQTLRYEAIPEPKGG